MNIGFPGLVTGIVAAGIAGGVALYVVKDTI